jgi:UDP-N-acetylmuramate: L-alanyl-gamma-D-glutamyl-meso-diaminopimelate ligase
MKLGAMQALIPESLAGADLVFCHGPRSGPNALAWDPRLALQPLGERARVFENIDDLALAVLAAARPGDSVLAMSNGSFGGIHERILAGLATPATSGYGTQAAALSSDALR